MSAFSSILIAFHQFFTCIALGNADLCLSLIFIIKANDDEVGITQTAGLYHQHNQSIQVTDGMTVISAAAGLQHKTSAATFHPCQNTLNQKLSHTVYTK
jgi:hypothetical protein